MAVWPAGRRSRVRLLPGAWTRGPKGFSRTVRRNSTDRRVLRLREDRRPEVGACRMLGALEEEVLRRAPTQSERRAASRIVKRIDELFGIDALARVEKLDLAARHVLRLERAQPLIAIIHGEAAAARDAALPSSALGKAA